MDEIINRLNTYYENFNATLQFLVAKQNGNMMDDYLYSLGYEKVAVYGMNDLGNCVVRELKDSKIVRLLYAVDQGSPKLFFDIDCYRLNEVPLDNKPDIVIVTLPYLYDEIYKDIEKALDRPTMSITQLVYDMDV